MIQIRQSLENIKITTSEKDTTANDAQLIAEARTNPDAFARLYRRHYEQIFRYCAHRLFDRQTAEDTTSVVFLKAVENFGRFKGTEQQFRNWLFKIATNAINSHIRKTVRRNILLDRFRPNNDNRKIEEDNDSKLAILEQAMLSLKPKYQTIITLRFFENLKLTQIAEITGSSPGTVRSQMARALAQMRNKIDSLQKES